MTTPPPSILSFIITANLRFVKREIIKQAATKFRTNHKTYDRLYRPPNTIFDPIGRKYGTERLDLSTQDSNDEDFFQKNRQRNENARANEKKGGTEKKTKKFIAIRPFFVPAFAPATGAPFFAAKKIVETASFRLTYLRKFRIIELQWASR
mgnify:FL=1